MVGADTPGGDQHPLEDAVGIPLHDAAVHEGAGVALVAIADDEFVRAGLAPGEVPFPAGRETPAAASAQAGFGDHRAEGLGGHLAERAVGGLISAEGDVFANVFRIDQAAVLENAAGLPGVERDVADAAVASAGGRIGIEQALDQAPVTQGLLDEGGSVFGFNPAIKDVVRLDGDQGPHLAKALAPTAREMNGVGLVVVRVELEDDVQSGLLQGGAQGRVQGQ